jgi:putative flippase GtrA
MSVSLQSLMFETAPAKPAKPAKSSVWMQLLTYLIIGAIASGAYVWLCTVFAGFGTGIPVWATNSVAYAIFLIPAYLANRRYAFQSNAPHRRALPRYVTVQVGSIIVTGLFSYVSYEMWGMETATGAFVALILTAGVKFVVLRAWAFATAH